MLSLANASEMQWTGWALICSACLDSKFKQQMISKLMMFDLTSAHLNWCFLSFNICSTFFFVYLQYEFLEIRYKINEAKPSKTKRVKHIAYKWIAWVKHSKLKILKWRSVTLVLISGHPLHLRIVNSPIKTRTNAIFGYKNAIRLD